MRFNTSHKVIAGFGLGVVALLVVAWEGFWTARQFITYSEVRHQSAQTLEELSSFLADIVDAETGQRGYLLTGDRSYLAPYLAATARIGERLAELGRRTSGDPATRGTVADLDRLAKLKLGELQQTIDLRAADSGQGLAEALKVVATGRGKQYMDELRVRVGVFERDVEQVRDESFQRSEQAARVLAWSIALLCPITLAFVICCGWLILRDLSIRTRVEANVRRQRAVLETVLASIGEGIVMADTQGQLQVFNPMARELLGSGPGNVSPDQWSDHFALFLEDGTTPFPAADLPLMRALRGESSDNVEMCVRRSGCDEVRVISITGRPISDEQGRFHGGVVVFHDVTDRKRSDQALRASEERFRMIVEGVSDYGIYTLDPQGRVTTWNAGAERLYGYTAKEILGEHLSRFYPDEAVEQGWPDRELHSAESLGHFSDEGWRRRADGTLFWTSVVLTGLRNEDGELIGFSKIARDLTERKRAEEALAANARQLKRSNQELEQFAYVASHDLKEPLRMVASYTRLLAEECEGKLGVEADKYIAYAVDGAKRMQELIDDLLNYSRVGRAEARMASVDLQRVAEKVLANLHTAIEASGALVTIDPLPTVNGNFTHLAQLLQNLIGNAIKFRGNAAPCVEVSCTREETGWLLRVADNGIGIAPEYHERVFQLFQRLHSRGTYEGTGIGLSICRKVVEQHGGRIWIESERGQGSTFYFTLPAEQTAQTQEQEALLV